MSDAETDPVSSSRIRRAVAAGDLDTARRFLGRPHWLTGTVVSGEQRGRTMGFPTANIRPEVLSYPPRGVYAGWLDTGGSMYRAVANIGTKPTFHEAHGETVEVHALDVQLNDLYGQRVRFFFEAFLRNERAFSSRDGLMHQIAVDCDSARSILDGAEPPPRFSL